MEQITFRCHKCRGLLQLLAANAGKKYRCPECLSVGIIPATAPTHIQGQAGPAAIPTGQAVADDVFGLRPEDAPPPAPALAGPRRLRDEDEREGPRSGRSSRRRKLGDIKAKREVAEPPERVRASLRGWRKVRLGINIIYIALCVWTVTILGYLALLPVLSYVTGKEVMSGVTNAGVGQMGEGYLAFVLLTLLAMMVGFCVTIAAIVGYCFCLFVPRTSALVWVLIALVLALFALGSLLLAFILPPMQLMSWLLGFSHLMAFLLFLRAVGVDLDVSWLVKSIQGLLILSVAGVGSWVAIVLLSVVFLISIGSRGSPDAADACAFGCGMLVAYVILFSLLVTILLRYLRVLRDTVAQIEEELAQRHHGLSGSAGYTPARE
jgi:hypothetical protein